MPNQLSQYLFAGLDFMVDTKGNIVFLEANSNPGLSEAYTQQYGVCTPLKKLSEALKDEKGIVFLYSREDGFGGREYDFRYKQCKKFFGKKCRRILLSSEELKNFELPLRDSQGKKVKDVRVICPRMNVNRELIKDTSLFVLNAPQINNLTLDKWKTYKVVKSIEGLTVPKTFVFTTQSELRKLIQKHGLKKFVIKPCRGAGGKSVFIVNTPKQLDNIILSKGDWILQEKVEIKKTRNKFWDIRVWVVNGKYAGAIKRTSKNAVVNFSLGGSVGRVEKRLQKRLAPIAESCIQKIEAFVHG